MGDGGLNRLNNAYFKWEIRLKYSIACWIHISHTSKTNTTINFNSDENDEDYSRNVFDHVGMEGNSAKNGEGDCRTGFDDGDTNSLKEVAEWEEELMHAQLLN